MSDTPTTGDLFKAKAFTADDLRAAVDAYMADPTTTQFTMGEGYCLNLAEAVRSHGWAKAAVCDADAPDLFRRAAVLTAIILARPEKR